MSYGQIKRRTEAVHQPEATNACEASNCPCRGTVSMGGDKFFCSAHAFADAALWPRVTEKLRDHDWLVGFHDDIQRMDRASQNWRGFAEQFWANQEDGEILAPHKQENAQPYMNRMRGELLYRAGLCKRASLRLPQPLKGRRGTFVNGQEMRKAA